MCLRIRVGNVGTYCTRIIDAHLAVCHGRNLTEGARRAKLRIRLGFCISNVDMHELEWRARFLKHPQRASGTGLGTPIQLYHLPVPRGPMPTLRLADIEIQSAPAYHY